MEIRFSKFRNFPDDDVRACATNNGVGADVKWTFGDDVRFTLYTNDGTYGGSNPKAASVEAHDRVIRALLQLDPDATIRTARAVYEGLEDFEKQRGK